MYFSADTANIPIKRRMQLKQLVEARRAMTERAPWSAIFIKGYALVADEFPELRRAYLRYPWAHLYEYRGSAAAVAVERDYHGEAAVFPIVIKHAASRTLADIGAKIRKAADGPFEEVEEFRRVERLGRCPLLVRRALMSIGLNIGRLRANYFGTFAFSVVSSLGAEITQSRALLTTMLNYGVLSPDGALDVRLIFDHRILDAAVAARALARLEQVLNGPILREVRAQPGNPIPHV